MIHCLLARGCRMGALLILLSAASVATAHATLIEYSGITASPGGTVSGAALTAHNTFISALGGAAVDDLESVTGAGSGANPFALSFTGSPGPVTGDLVANGSGTLRTSPTGGQFATSGSQYLFFQNGFTITFSTPISSFGFYATDAGDGAADLQMTLTGDETTVLLLETAGDPNGALLFWGFIDDMNSYSSITVLHTDQDGIGYDDFTIGAAFLTVPEPATLGLFGLGIGGIAFAVRRRKR